MSKAQMYAEIFELCESIIIYAFADSKEEYQRKLDRIKELEKLIFTGGDV